MRIDTHFLERSGVKRRNNDEPDGKYEKEESY
jgi:hypothetical protein